MAHTTIATPSKDIVLCNMDQWEDYKHQVLLKLGAESLLDVVNEKAHPELEDFLRQDYSVTPESESRQSKSHAVNLERNYKALIIINSQLSNKVFIEFKKHVVAKELWEALQEHFHEGNMVETALEVLNSMCAHSIIDFGYQDYIDSFQRKAEKYAAHIGTPLDKIAIIAFFMRGLNESKWSSFKDEIYDSSALSCFEDVVKKFKVFAVDLGIPPSVVVLS